jgi:foldase protein PrsA
VAESKPTNDAGKTTAKPAAPRQVTPAARPAQTAKRPSEPIWRRIPALANQPATLIGATGLVILAVVVLVALGFWNSNIRPGRETAVEVGSETYDMTYFTRRLKALLNDPVSAGTSPSQILALPEKLAKDIIEEEVLLQRAGNLGVAVSDSEIDSLMAERLGVPFTTDGEGKIQGSPAFASSVRNRLQLSGLSLAEYRRSIHAQQLRTGVRKHFDSQIPRETPAVLLRQLAVNDKAKAEELKQQIEGGADFAALASSVSEDSLTRSQGGLRDWAPKGFLPDEFENLAYSLPIGKVSDPFESSGKWVIVRVEERQEARELSQQERDQAVNKRLVDWVDEQGKDLNAKHYLDDGGRSDYALKHSGALERAINANSSGRPTLPIPGTGSNP